MRGRRSIGQRYSYRNALEGVGPAGRRRKWNEYLKGESTERNQRRVFEHPCRYHPTLPRSPWRLLGLVAGDLEHCGVTVHKIDRGIDTGAIAAQALIKPTTRDNFSTYPLLQIANAIPLLKEAVRDALNGKLETLPAPGAIAVMVPPDCLPISEASDQLRRPLRN